MSGFSDARKAKILDAAMGGTAYSEAAEGHLALATVAILGSDTGATIKEPTWTGYARIPMKSTDWNPAEHGVKTSKNAMIFAECTAGEGTHIAWALCTTAETASGLVICSGVVPATAVSKGITPKFAAGALAFNLIDT